MLFAQLITIITCSCMLFSNKVKTFNYFTREYYKPASARDENNDQSTCQLDGNWSRDILKCVPECGTISSAIPLVMNGWNALAPFPWHVNLYLRTKIDYQFWCGGTLISEAVVVTGSCFSAVIPSFSSNYMNFKNSRSLCVER